LNGISSVLQSNKTRESPHFDWVADRQKILRRLSEQRPGNLPELSVCIQVNIDREPQKAGVLPEGAEELASLAMQLPGLRLRGLMTIPRVGSEDYDSGDSYQRMSGLFRSLRAAGRNGHAFHGHVRRPGAGDHARQHDGSHRYRPARPTARRRRGLTGLLPEC
jgi:uncharacterized pyridoxal phosphate-containing UPF0001 family protein